MHKSLLPKNIIRNKKKGILFWITGFSGSGKTAIAKRLNQKSSKLMDQQFYSAEIILGKYLTLKSIQKTQGIKMD